MLIRHPLQKHFTAAAKTKDDSVLLTGLVSATCMPGGDDGTVASGSETEGMSSAGEEEEDDDQPMTQQIDPRPLAGVCCDML